MVTEEEKIQQWCQQQSVCTLSYQEYQKSNYQGYVLFSIANNHIIPRNLIEKHNVQHAINYHNALLPSYAGTNPTTWAIINGEKKHGVTWHKISDEIDAGDIIRQEEITISREDTTYSLNMKCTQKALALFKILLSDLSNNQLQFQAQALNKRSYFSLNRSLKNYGFINDCESLMQISRYCRALDFGGDQVNQIATAKLSFKGSVYLLGVPIWVEKPNSFFDLKGLYIVSKDKALHFPSIYNCYGIEKNISKIINFEELQKYSITLNDNQCHQLKYINKQERSYALAINSLKSKVNSTLHLSMNHTIQESLEYSINTSNLSTTQIVGAISLVLLRIFHQNNFLVSCYVEDPDLRHLSNLVDTKYMLELKQVFNEEKLLNFQEYIQNHSRKKQNITKDFYYRYNCMELLTDIAIYHGNSFNTIFAHRLNFVINNGQLNITGIKTDSIELKGIVSALTTMFKQYKYYLNSSTSIKDIPLLSKEEYQKIIIDWNNTDKPYPRDKTICQLFEEQVEKMPNHIAIVFEEKQFTYKELNAKSNQLARYLQTLSNIQPDDLIAICLDKSLEMIVGILGILKSGAAYVPIDPNYPNERVKYILNDTRASLLLSQSQYTSRLKNISKAIIIPLDEAYYENFSMCNLKSLNESNNLAYVIYTSGTTGEAKGACIMHKGLCNMALSQQEILNVDGTSKVLQFASIGFDASIWEIFGALVSGSRLYIISDAKKINLKYFQRYLSENEISHATLPPKIIESLDLKYLTKYLCSAGEALSIKAFNKLIKSKYPVNAYGPTEATVCSTIYHCYHDSINSSIGKAVANNKCYVVDAYNNPLPAGVIGELCISGVGLARGYLNKAKLTSEKFILNHFTSEIDKKNSYDRLYATGDLVRWLADGNLEYIGRKDTQVKIRGFRVELSEIENAAMTITTIRQAVAINKVINDDHYLFVYFTASSQVQTDLIIEQLKNKLPYYMVPSAILQLDEIPLTTNGKTDINALPNITFRSSQVYIKPRNEQESIICQAFSNVLSIEKIGVNDDFFTLGGNSIKAIQLAIALQSHFDISISEIFDLRTPHKLAKSRVMVMDLLINRLQQIKKTYCDDFNIPINKVHKTKRNQYLNEIINMPNIIYRQKPIKNVLLTGGTGFLGCNVLNQLLISTTYHIYLCIRAENQMHAIKRITKKYQVYFDNLLEEKFHDRITYLVCDLEKQQIGLTDIEYRALIENIDSIIHCAALTKHYGTKNEFYLANVQSTINLLEACELTKLKDFHYISTVSVISGLIQEGKQNIFTESDQLTSNSQWNSPYNKTKYLGELETIKWRQKGVNSNIYRVGNLAFMENGKLQEDIQSNLFAHYVQFIAKLGCTTKHLDSIEISPADITAKAIIKLFDKVELRNMTHHVFNNNSVQLTDGLKKNNYNITLVSFAVFIDRLVKYLQNHVQCDLAGRFLLRMGWQSNKEFFSEKSKSLILKDKTDQILSQLDFDWPIIETGHLNMYIRHLLASLEDEILCA